MNMRKIKVLLAAGTILFLATPLFAQMPAAFGGDDGTASNQKSWSGGRFGGDIDNYMETRGWPGMGFDKYFFFIGGRYQGRVNPELGFAAWLGDYYLGFYYTGRIIQGNHNRTSHNNNWENQWDEDDNGSSIFRLTNRAALLFGVPNVGGFRFDWVASDSTGTEGPAFEKFKGSDTRIPGVDNAEGTFSGSMSFVLSYGNVFAQNYKLDVAVGYATPNTLKVTGGQIGSDIYKATEITDSKVYGKLGFGYNLPASSSIDADYTFVLSPGDNKESTRTDSGGTVTTTKRIDEADYQHLVNINYSKSINWDDTVTVRFKPNILFNMYSYNNAFENESGNREEGTETSLFIIPTVALGMQYKPTEKLSLYTGTTITLFDLALGETEKGADGGTTGTKSDIIAGSQASLDLGATFAITDGISIDFNIRQMLDAIFQTPLAPTMKLYVTFKK